MGSWTNKTVFTSSRQARAAGSVAAGPQRRTYRSTGRIRRWRSRTRLARRASRACPAKAAWRLADGLSASLDPSLRAAARKWIAGIDKRRSTKQKDADTMEWRQSRTLLLKGKTRDSRHPHVILIIERPYQRYTLFSPVLQMGEVCQYQKLLKGNLDAVLERTNFSSLRHSFCPTNNTVRREILGMRILLKG